MNALPAFAPDFAIRINGHAVPESLRRSITAVRYEDGVDASDRVEIEIANIDLRWLKDHIRGLGFQPFPTGIKLGPVHRSLPGTDGMFDLDNGLELDLGYAPNPLEPVFDGEVTGVEADFPASGMPVMRIVAQDKLHRLAEGKYGRGFGPLPDVLIAAILSAENLLIPLIDPTIAAASTAMTVLNLIFKGSGTKQKGQSDLELMKEIAARFDAEFWVDGDVLHFSRFFKEYSPSVTLTWGQSLLSFSPKVTTIGQVAAVAAKFTLKEIPLDFVVTVGWDFDREALSVMVVPGAASAAAKTLVGPVLTLITHPIGSPADITNSALFIAHKLRSTINNRLTGVGAAVGDPNIRAGAVIRLDGLGPDFSGDYRVVAATHTVDRGGYRTDFKVRKEIIP